MTSQEIQAGHREQVEVDIQNCRILVLDDSPPVVKFIEMMLKAHGFSNIETAFDGQEGLEKIEAFNPELLILDIRMPVMDGLDVLRVLRQNPRFQDLPVIVETASETKEERNRILAAGGDDILSKPIDTSVMLARVRQHLTKRILMRQLLAYQARLEMELDTARGMQADLMPKDTSIRTLEERYDCRLFNHTATSSELGGDFWGIEELDDQRFAIFIVDFSGHGVGAAMNTFRLHTMMRDTLTPPTSPARYIGQLNNQLNRLLPIGQFATTTYAIVDCRKNTLTYAASASPFMIIGRDGGKTIESYECAGPPLGAMKDIQFEDHCIPFNKGDFLFLYSDAFFESPDTDGNIIGMDNVADLVEKHAAHPVQEQFKQILDDFYGHAVQPLPDDLTAIWLTRQ